MVFTRLDNECNGNPCEYARLAYHWSSGTPAGVVWVDDVYLGAYLDYFQKITPRVATLGDLTIIKKEGDGDIYPYVSESTVGSGESFRIWDANCASTRCEYHLSTSLSEIDVNTFCFDQ